MSARAHNLQDMVEYLEAQIMDSDAYDFTQIMDETEKYIQKSKALIPPRPIQMQDG